VGWLTRGFPQFRRLVEDIAGIVRPPVTKAKREAAESKERNRATQKAFRMLVYVSSGGTCRDPMAKVITTKLLEHRKLKHPLRIEAKAFGPINKSEASYAARYTIKKMYKEDLLAQHKPELLTRETVEQAHLILVMDNASLKAHRKTLPKERLSY